MRELGAYLGQQGVSVVAPCLPGFGQHPEALQGLRWEDWLRTAAADLRRLQERCAWVFAAGLSMGAALALYLAVQVPIAGVAAIAPPTRLRNPLAPLIPLARYLFRWHELGTDQDLVDPTAHQRHWYYTRVPTAAIGEMYKLLQVSRRAVPYVRVPVLLIQSRQDGSLRPEGALALLNQLGTADKRLLWLERSGHNVLVDAERERVFAEVYEFIEGHVKEA
jgi:carboxylesterase